MSGRVRSRSSSSLVSFESRRRISTASGAVMRRFKSSDVGYGSSGGFDFFSKSLTSGFEGQVNANEKQTMQNLNDRLASYLEKVHSLEKANSKLELQIKTFFENKSPMERKDMSSNFKIMSDLRSQIFSSFLYNADLHLKLDNSRLAAEDFKTKYETEQHLRMIVEADLPRLRGVLGDIKLTISDLDNQHSGLKEELMYLKKTHEEDLHNFRANQSGSVNVGMDSGAQTDLGKTLEELRVQYETLIQKKRKEVEEWYQSKVEMIHTEVSSSRTEIKTSQTEISSLKRTSQSLEGELQGLISMKQQLEQSVTEVSKRFSATLGQLQIHIDYLQEELRRLNVNIQEQATEYQLLLDIRMRLEMEIAEYRRLLGGEEHKTTSNITQKEIIIEKKEETHEEIEDVHNPHLQRRVKVIVEEIIDGQVVSTKVEEKVQDLN